MSFNVKVQKRSMNDQVVSLAVGKALRMKLDGPITSTPEGVGAVIAVCCDQIGSVLGIVQKEHGEQVLEQALASMNQYVREQISKSAAAFDKVVPRAREILASDPLLRDMIKAAGIDGSDLEQLFAAQDRAHAKVDVDGAGDDLIRQLREAGVIPMGAPAFAVKLDLGEMGVDPPPVKERVKTPVAQSYENTFNVPTPQNITRSPESRCAGCGAPNNSISAASDGERHIPPEPGHASVCFRCGHIGIFDENMRVRALTDEEMIEIAGNRALVELQAQRAAYWKAREGK